MDTLRDFELALRNLGRRPGFAGIAIATIALGIGVNTALFSVLHAVVLRPLPYDDPDRLVAIWETDGSVEGSTRLLSYPDFFDYRDRCRSFQSMAVARSVRQTLTTPEGSERLEVARVTASFFPLLGASFELGRSFRPEEDEPGSAPVVVLGHEFWQSRFGGSTDVLGRTLTLDGKSWEIVGVLGRDFSFPLEVSEAELWTSVAADENFLPQRGMHSLVGIGRLAEGSGLAAAADEMSSIATQLAAEYPDKGEEAGVRVVPLHEQVVGGSRGTLYLLVGMVGVVLLIACSNVANLLLVRGRTREREMAVRAALGAGRTRIVRHVLSESVVLGLAGGALGLLLAAWGASVLRATLPVLDIPRLAEVSVDPTVLGYTLALSLATGVLLGVVPALQASRVDLNASLKVGGRVHSDSGRRVRGGLVVAEIALSLLLLVGAGLLVRSFVRLMQVDPGFRTENALAFRVLAHPSRHPTADRTADFYRALLDRLEQLPGVVAAGASSTVPLTGGSWTTGFQLLSRPELGGEDGVEFRYYTATPDYFDVMGIPLRRGRLFTEEDRRGRPGAVVVNETMARRYWPGGDPLGERLTFGISFGEEDEPTEWEIVGVVGDVRHQSLDAEMMPQIYVPYRQQTNSAMHFVVRTEGDASAMLPAVRAAVAELDREAPLYLAGTLAEARARSGASRRSAMQLVGGLAILAILLAAIGLYGVVAFSVAQRTREIGVRMSLGARAGDILRLVLGQGMGLALLGTGLGLAGASAVTRLLTRFLYGVTPTDPATLAATSLLLLAVALTASFLPALHAARVDPMTALRCE